jgi:hypothetical protein
MNPALEARAGEARNIVDAAAVETTTASRAWSDMAFERSLGGGDDLV